MACKDVEHYWTALDKALGSFHRLKIEEINRIIKELWSVTYMGEDIDTIEIVSGRVEINQCVGYTRQVFTKSFLGDDAAALAADLPVLRGRLCVRGALDWPQTGEL